MWKKLIGVDDSKNTGQYIGYTDLSFITFDCNNIVGFSYTMNYDIMNITFQIKTSKQLLSINLPIMTSKILKDVSV